MIKKIDKKTKIYLIEKTNNFERNLHIFKIKKYRRHMIFVFAVFIFLSKIVINRYREEKKKKTPSPLIIHTTCRCV